MMLKRATLATMFAFSCESSFAAPAAGPVMGAAWQLLLPNDSGTLTLRWIPAGHFVRGSPESEPGRKADEGPPISIEITRGFWLGETPVTIGQWKRLMGVGVREQLAQHIADDTLHLLDGKLQRLRELMRWSPDADPAVYLASEDDHLPMYFVSWDDALACCRQLNLRERAAGRLPAGYEYNLPTEAQWEYACRSGTTGPTYAGANTTAVLNRIAWYDQNSADGYSGRPLGPTHSGPRQVGLKEPNAWGLHDMLGNVWEWCRDWYGPYDGTRHVGPTGPATGILRVNRGGSFGSSAHAERSATRAGNPPAEASAYRGFRLALAPLSI